MKKYYYKIFNKQKRPHDNDRHSRRTLCRSIKILTHWIYFKYPRTEKQAAYWSWLRDKAIEKLKKG